MPALLNQLSRAVIRLYPFANGQGRLIDKTFLGRLRFAQNIVSVRCRGGYQLDVMPNDHIGRHIYLTGEFDGSIVRVLKSFCRGDDRILDIGANVGSVSCALLNALPGCRVVSVEPQADVFALLAKNVARVGGDRAKALNVAVSDADGEGQMALTRGNTGGTRIVQSAESSEDSSPRIQVRMISGQKLFEQSGLDRIDLVKIDVEGFEETVLRALQGTIQSQRPRAVLFEHVGDLNSPTAPIRELFDQCGYQLFGLSKSLWRDALIPIGELAARNKHAHDFVATPVK